MQNNFHKAKKNPRTVGAVSRVKTHGANHMCKERYLIPGFIARLKCSIHHGGQRIALQQSLAKQSMKLHHCYLSGFFTRLVV